jgi:DNA-binding winged helix-turn-helix (wHTH) protein
MEESADVVVEFGPFRLSPARRLLTSDGIPVPLGERALQILLVLIARAPKIVGKSALLEQAWSGMFVVESNRRYQMAGLRKALGDGRGGSRYISTAAGRGYCFVASLSRSTPVSSAKAVGAAALQQASRAVGSEPPIARN